MTATTTIGATISEELGAFAADIAIERLPHEVVDKAKACLLWGLCGAATTDSSYANNVVHREIAAAATSPAQQGMCTVLLNGRSVAATDAIFANAVLFDQTMCDSYLAAAHFGPAVLAPVLAIAEERSAAGPEVIAAIVAGYEVAAAMTKNHLAATMDRGWRGALAFGGFGAVAASARMMGLNAEQSGNAIAFAAGLTCGSMEPMYARGMDNKLVMGIVSRNGYTAAALAEHGMRAARTAIEGKAGFLVHFPGTKDFEHAITPHLGRDYEILNVTFKRFEASGRAHTPMLLSLKVAEEENIDPDDIESVELQLNAFEEAYPPHREHDDIHMTEGVAGALTYRSGRSDLIVWHDNPTFQRLTRLIQISPAPDLGPYCARIRIAMRTGESHLREMSVGPKAHAFDFEGTVNLAKARQEVGKLAFSSRQLDELVEVVGKLETVSSVRDLMELVVKVFQK